MMLNTVRLYALVTALMVFAQGRVADARADERGLGTLEIVAITLGLFTLAGAAIAVISGAVNIRLDGIR